MGVKPSIGGQDELTRDLTLLAEVENKSIYLEEYAKEMIKNEEIHSLTVEKMLRDYE